MATENPDSDNIEEFVAQYEAIRTHLYSQGISWYYMEYKSCNGRLVTITDSGIIRVDPKLNDYVINDRFKLVPKT